MEGLYARLAEILDTDQVGDGDRLNDFDTWDSLATLTLISILDDEYQVSLYTHELQPLVTVGDLMALVAERRERA